MKSFFAGMIAGGLVAVVIMFFVFELFYTQTDDSYFELKHDINIVDNSGDFIVGNLWKGTVVKEIGIHDGAFETDQFMVKVFLDVTSIGGVALLNVSDDISGSHYYYQASLLKDGK